MRESWRQQEILHSDIQMFFYRSYANARLRWMVTTRIYVRFPVSPHEYVITLRINIKLTAKKE